MGDVPEPSRWDRARIVMLVVLVAYGVLMTVWNATRTGHHDWFGSILFTAMLVAGLLLIRRHSRR